jgi:hypothetical protein
VNNLFYIALSNAIACRSGQFEMPSSSQQFGTLRLVFMQRNSHQTKINSNNAPNMWVCPTNLTANVNADNLINKDSAKTRIVIFTKYTEKDEIIVYWKHHD